MRRPIDLGDRYQATTGSVLLTCVEALVRVIFDQIRADARAGRRTAAFVSGYQGSPLGTFDLTLARTGRLLDDYFGLGKRRSRLDCSRGDVGIGFPSTEPGQRETPCMWSGAAPNSDARAL